MNLSRGQLISRRLEQQLNRFDHSLPLRRVDTGSQIQILLSIMPRRALPVETPARS